MKSTGRLEKISNELAELKLVLAEAIEMLDQQSEVIESLEKENKELKDIIAKTRGVLPKKNSCNSNLPPSKDLPRPDRRRSLREKSSRNTGGQTGHKGFTLEFNKKPNQIIAVYIHSCKKCGAKLDTNKAFLNASRQQIELPPVFPFVKQYDTFSNTCACGCTNVAQFPAGIKSNVQYGPRVRSMINYLSIRQYIPYNRIQEMLADCFMLPISQGTIYNTLERTAQKSKGIFDSIKTYLEQSTWLGSDETGIYVNGKNWYYWVWQNKKASYIRATPSRRKDHIREFFKDGFPSAILSSDQYAAQLSTPAKGHQICYPHLYRRIAFVQQIQPSNWLQRIKKILKKAEKLKKQNAQRKRTDRHASQLEQQLNQLLLVQLNKKKQKESVTLQKSLIKHRHAIFTFLYHKEVPPDNNSSEQAIRNAKVKMKISGFFKSQQQTYAQLRSIIDTLIKNNKPILHSLQKIEQDNNFNLGLLLT